MNIDIQIQEKLHENPKVDIFNITTDNGQRVWVKISRATHSNILHKLAYRFSKNPILIPVTEKTSSETLLYEVSKLKNLQALSIPVPEILSATGSYFVLEDRGPTVRDLFKNGLVEDSNKLCLNIIHQLANLHNVGEFHGGAHIKNITMKNNVLSFIDFEESFEDSIKIDILQFRDLFLFLFSLSKEKLSIDYSALVQNYIELTHKTDTIQQFHLLISQVDFLMKIINNKIVWKILDRDTQSVYRLLKQLQTLES